jgi:ParB-like chromosome segregation protein Spo0J
MSPTTTEDLAETLAREANEDIAAELAELLRRRTAAMNGCALANDEPVPVIEGPYQVCRPLTRDEYNALAQSIAQNDGIWPWMPVLKDEIGNTLDGYHREHIAAWLGYEPPVEEIAGLTEEQKLALARTLNAARRQLTRAERKEMLRQAILDNPEASSRSIAAEVGVDHKTTEKLRGEMVDRGEIPQIETRTDKTGRKQPPKTPKGAKGAKGAKSSGATGQPEAGDDAPGTADDSGHNGAPSLRGLSAAELKKVQTRNRKLAGIATLTADLEKDVKALSNMRPLYSTQVDLTAKLAIKLATVADTLDEIAKFGAAQ